MLLPPDFEIFYGLATPPTSYGGYGGKSQNAKEDGAACCTPWLLCVSTSTVVPCVCVLLLLVLRKLHWLPCVPRPCACTQVGAGGCRGRACMLPAFAADGSNLRAACRLEWSTPGQLAWLNHTLCDIVQSIAAAKYTFEYPASWKSETINKRDKGTQGVDCRVRRLPGAGQPAAAVAGGLRLLLQGVAPYGHPGCGFEWQRLHVECGVDFQAHGCIGTLLACCWCCEAC